MSIFPRSSSPMNFKRDTDINRKGPHIRYVNIPQVQLTDELLREIQTTRKGPHIRHVNVPQVQLTDELLREIQTSREKVHTSDMSMFPRSS